jgi:hypothetical protein
VSRAAGQRENTKYNTQKTEETAIISNSGKHVTTIARQQTLYYAYA